MAELYHFDNKVTHKPSALQCFVNDPFRHLRDVRFEDAKRNFAVGMADDDGIEVELKPAPHNEFFLVRQGAVVIDTAEGTFRFSNGDAGVIPRGLECSWKATSDCVRVFGISPGQPAPGTSGLVCVDPDGPLELVGKASEAITITRPLPDLSRRTDFETHDGAFCVGVWRTEAFRRLSISRTDHEFMEIVRGQAEVDLQRDGTVERVQYPAGTGFFAAHGADYALGSNTAFSKVFCVCVA